MIYSFYFIAECSLWIAKVMVYFDFSISLFIQKQKTAMFLP